ncbi:hypothetical protein BC940DRAFT_311104 [Gongronella butleri]|nr:hypothetical protein BC940DRAFT_311104 [Gongronella butleri]
MAATVHNETTGKIYTLVPEEPLVLGRNDVANDDNKEISVQITLLSDGRCFVCSLTKNPVFVRNAALLEPHAEVEAFDQQIIHLLPGQLFPFKLTLPKKMEKPTPTVTIHASRDTDDSYSENTTDDDLDGQNDEEPGSMDLDASADESDEYMGSGSAESSLIGSEKDWWEDPVG